MYMAGRNGGDRRKRSFRQATTKKVGLFEKLQHLDRKGDITMVLRKGYNWRLISFFVVLTFGAVIAATVFLQQTALAGEPAECPKPKAITINVDTSALLLLHWQNDLVMPEGKLAKDFWERVRDDKTIERTQLALQAAREANMFIIYVNLGYSPGYPEVPPRKLLKGYIADIVDKKMLLRGTWGAENVKQLKPLGEEAVLWNYTAGAFEATALDRILLNQGRKDLFLSGIATHYVVETTMRSGRDKGYRNFVLMDCCNADTKDHHCWPLANTMGHMATVTDSSNFIEALKKAKK